MAENDIEAEKYRAKADDAIKMAYTAATQGDMYQAYLDLDNAIKYRAAAARTNVYANPLIGQFVVMQHWNKLNRIAEEASSKNPEARLKLDESAVKLRKRREENERA